MTRDPRETAIYVAYEDCEPQDGSLPEKNLLRAILINAMHDLRKNGRQAQRAIDYFLSPEDDYLFSFRSVCSHLNLDEHKVLQVVGLSPGCETQAATDDEAPAAAALK